MIAGIGTDIVEIARIKDKIERNSYFREHVFSEEERTYCDAQRSPFIHFAARWAVKEAYLKAFGVRFIGNHRLPEINTLHEDNGKPYLELLGDAKKEFEEKGFRTVHVSISHTEEYAIAYVIIEV